MSTPDPRIETIFHEALTGAPAEREAFVTKACAGDEALQKELQRLLAAHEEAGTYFERPNSPEIEAELARLKPEEVGERIGPYKLMENIGEGGFGTVWVADQEQPVRRRVALKIIKLGMDTKEVIARFGQERQALAMMDHPHIAKVFDAGATQWGRPYFVMELVRGIKITEYCDQANLPTADRLALFIQVCNAVQHAHQKGIIHRDLKPSNILVTLHDGLPVPKVIDFGVAKATQGRLAERTIYTQFQQMIGTPLYMSPEQAEMSGLDIDTRSDIYSLGVLLYELLVGRTPFDPETLMRAGLDEIRRVIREEEPPKPSTALQTMAAEARASVAQHRQTDGAKMARLLSGELDWIVMKALEKDRTRRYETANGFAEDIRRYLANEPVTAAAPSAIYRLQKFARRNRLIFAAGSAVALTLITGIAVSTWQADRAKRALAETEIARQQATAGEEKAKVLVREASRSDAATAQARLTEGKWQEGVAYLGRAIRYDPDNQNAYEALWLAVRYGKPDAGRLPTCLLKHENFVTSAVFSPDGTRVVTASHDKTARVWDAKSGAPIGAPLKHEDHLSCAVFSPDGTRVVTSSRTRAQVWDAETGAPIGASLKHEGFVHGAAFSPDGTRVATASEDKTARVWDAKTGAPIGAPLKHEDDVRSAAFSPDGVRMLTASYDKTARVWNVNSGAPIGAPLQHDAEVASAAFSPDGTRVVTASVDKTARVWDAETGALIGQPLRHESTVYNATFSPDGSRVVTVSRDKSARVWDAKSGALVGAPLRHEADVTSAAFSPDGARVVTAGRDKTARVWDTKSGTLIGAPLEHEADVTSAAFSPDGTRVITASLDKTARVRDAKSGAYIGTPLCHENFVTSAAFSPDGTRVVTASWNTARVWDAKSGAPIGIPLKHKTSVPSAAFSPDGTRVVTASEDKTARVWDAKSGAPIGAPLQHDAEVASAAFSPDGTLVVTTSEDYAARVWDTKSGTPVGSPLIHNERFTRMLAASKARAAFSADGTFKSSKTIDTAAQSGARAAFSPDGTRVVTAGPDNTARIWDAKSGAPIGTPLKHQNSVNSAAFSPDGTRVVTVSRDQSVRVWDVKSGAPIGTPLKHEGTVKSAAFSPDGTRVVTASLDRTARVWDAESGAPIGTPLKHEGGVVSAAFNPDGTRVVTASLDNTARVWDAKTGASIGAPLQHEADVRGAAFSPDGTRVVSMSADNTARVWDMKGGAPIGPDTANRLIEFLVGARLDPQLGSLQLVSNDERMALWKTLEPALAALPDWRFAAEQAFTHNPQAALVSPTMPITIRQAATSLIETYKDGLRLAFAIDPILSFLPFREAVAIDPAHPLLPFAFANLESEKTNTQPANLIRAAWLVDYGLKRLPADTSANDLRLAARFVANVARSLPELKPVTSSLLDRAAKLKPEDEEAKAPRAELEK